MKHVFALTPALLAALLGTLAPVAHAQDVTGTAQGAAADPVSGGGTLDTTPGDFNQGRYILSGNPGGNSAPSGVSISGTAINAHDANLTGGHGSLTTGTNDPNDPNNPGAYPDIVNAGTGGSGLSVHDNFNNGNGSIRSIATVTSGTYIGGVGGTAAGTANLSLSGGYGGDGLNINDSLVTVNGGTFTGGSSGDVNGTAPNFGSGFAGNGINVNFNGDAVINGGTFNGANGASFTETDPNVQYSPGAAGAGVIVLTNGQHTTSIFGGTFNAGSSGALFGTGGNTITPATPGDGLAVYGGTTTLYGTGFTYTITEDNMTRTGTGPVTITQGPNGEQPFGTITGFLQNNSQVTPTTITYGVIGGTLILAPEPSSLAVLGIGLLSLGALTLKARRIPRSGA